MRRLALSAACLLVAAWSLPEGKPKSGDVVGYGAHGNTVSFQEISSAAKGQSWCDVLVMARNTTDPPDRFRMVDSDFKDGQWIDDNMIWAGDFIGHSFTVMPGVNEIDVWDFGRPGVVIDQHHLTPDLRIPVRAGDKFTIPIANKTQGLACRDRQGGAVKSSDGR